MVYGEPLIFGHEPNSAMVGMLTGASTATTAGNRGTWEIYDSSRASVSNNILTLKKGGTYKLTYYGNKVTGGTAVAGSFTVTVYHNSTSVGTSPATITASANDTIKLQSKATPSGSGSLRVSYTLFVEEVTA